MHVGYGADNKASSSLPFSQSTLQRPCETRQVVVTVPVTTRRGAGPAQGEDLLQDLAENRTCWSSGRADLAGPAGVAAERAASWKRLGAPLQSLRLGVRPSGPAHCAPPTSRLPPLLSFPALSSRSSGPASNPTPVERVSQAPGPSEPRPSPPARAPPTPHFTPPLPAPSPQS